MKSQVEPVVNSRRVFNVLSCLLSCLVFPCLVIVVYLCTAVVVTFSQDPSQKKAGDTVTTTASVSFFLSNRIGWIEAWWWKVSSFSDCQREALVCKKCWCWQQEKQISALAVGTTSHWLSSRREGAFTMWFLVEFVAVMEAGTAVLTQFAVFLTIGNSITNVCNKLL